MNAELTNTLRILNYVSPETGIPGDFLFMEGDTVGIKKAMLFNMACREYISPHKLITADSPYMLHWQRLHMAVIHLANPNVSPRDLLDGTYDAAINLYQSGIRLQDILDTDYRIVLPPTISIEHEILDRNATTYKTQPLQKKRELHYNLWNPHREIGTLNGDQVDYNFYLVLGTPHGAEPTKFHQHRVNFSVRPGEISTG